MVITLYVMRMTVTFMLKVNGSGVMWSITKFLEKQLKIKVNPDKTKVANRQKLGLSYCDAYISASTRKGYWRNAHSKILNYSLTNRKLDHLGLIRCSSQFEVIKLLNYCILNCTYGGVRGQ